VIWAIDALRRRGYAETFLDLAGAALRALELERAEPDSADDPHARPAALLRGETGPLLVAFRLVRDDDYRGLGTVYGGAGNTLVLLRVDRDGGLAADMAGVLARAAAQEDGLANWPGSPRPQLIDSRGRVRLQWCTGLRGPSPAPGSTSTRSCWWLPQR